MTRITVDPMQLAKKLRRQLVMLERAPAARMTCADCGCFVRDDDGWLGEHAEGCGLGQAIAATAWMDKIPTGPVITDEAGRPLGRIE